MRSSKPAKPSVSPHARGAAAERTKETHGITRGDVEEYVAWLQSAKHASEEADAILWSVVPVERDFATNHGWFSRNGTSVVQGSCIVCDKATRCATLSNPYTRLRNVALCQACDETIRGPT
jgi:hypothetical protein